MYLKQIPVGSMGNLSYLIANPLERIGTVIDPGWPGAVVDRIIETASDDGVDIRYIIATHSHYDHAGGIRDLIEKTGAEMIIHEDESSGGPPADITVKDGDLLSLGGLPVRIIHTPGHSPGSICIYSGNKLFTGDTLFVGGCGRTDLPGSDPEALYKSLYTKILALPEDTEVYPGHDYGKAHSSTIGRERESNPYLRCDSLEEFLRLRMG